MKDQMNELQVYMNGKYIPLSQASFPLLNYGVQEGFGVFEMTRTFNGKPFKLREHIARLFRSLRYVRFDIGLSQDEVEQISLRVVELNEPLRGENGDYWIGHTIFNGGTWPVPSNTPTVAIHCVPLPFVRWAKIYKNGVHGVVTNIRRTPPECVDPKVKVLSRINLQLAHLEAQRVDPEALPIMLDFRGNVTEGFGMNALIVKKRTIITPSLYSILDGVSKQTVIELARELGIETRESDFQPYDIYNADEAFFTTTSRCVIPITRVDGLPLSGGKPGNIAMDLLKQWSKRVGVDIVKQALSHLNETE